MRANFSAATSPKPAIVSQWRDKFIVSCLPGYHHSGTWQPVYISVQEKNTMEKLLDERETAWLLEMSVSWLRYGRSVGTGPAFVKIGRAVRYRPEDITAWLNSQFSGGK